MGAEDQLVIVQSVLGLALLVFVMGWMRRRAKLDRYHESLFALRDELFDYTRKNGMPFDLPACRLMRDLLNGGFRAAVAMKPLRFAIVAATMFENRQQEPAGALSAAIEAIEDPDIRARFKRIRSDFTEEFLAFFGLAGQIVKLAFKFDRFKHTARAHVDRWIDELAVFGSKDTVAHPLFGSRGWFRRPARP